MSVYPVREDTLLVKRNVEELDLEEKKFLEVGVGNAELSITAAEKGAEVKAIDINSKAVDYARERFEEEELEAEIVESDLFEEVNGKYGLIVFNPPYLAGPEGIGDEKMWRGGESGLEAAESFLREADNYLADDGKAWVVLSSRTNYEKLVEKFDLKKVDAKKLWFETIFLHELRRFF